MILHYTTYVYRSYDRLDVVFDTYSNVVLVAAKLWKRLVGILR